MPCLNVFRNEAGTWGRIPLAELPHQFVWMNLYPSVDREWLKSQQYFIRAAVTAALYRTGSLDDHRALLVTVDRRIRNPMTLGCDRGAVERIYGVEKYEQWRGLGSWLDKSEAEALNLLRRKSEGAKP